MEDIRPYSIDEERRERRASDEDRERRAELEAARSEEEVPFHIPRD
ncbi:MAG TPA: hypothetical protein VFM36_07710 [Thermoanaerobaculia bacterium]|nr:hypothetical protein [Thermoanaerobaculia bacterium]